MASNVNLEGFQDTGYFSRAWALVTQDKGWWKPVLLLGLAALVPIVGPLCVLGYCAEWARRIAWGATDAPERHVKVGELLRSGWRVFVVIAGWSVLMGIVGGVLDSVPVLGGLLTFAWNIFSVFLGMLVTVASVRATIYQNFKAGYRAGTIWEMGKRDVYGLLRAWVIKLVGGLIIVAAAVCIVLPALIGAIPYLLNVAQSLSGYYYMSDYEAGYLAITVVGYVLRDLGPSILLAFVASVVLGSMLSLLIYAAVGLWLRQFDVPAWGKDEDPLPQTARAQEPVSELPERPAPAEPVQSAEPVAPAAPASPAEPAPSAAPVPANEPPAPPAPIPMPPVSEPQDGESAKKPPVPEDAPAAGGSDVDEYAPAPEPPVPGEDKAFFAEDDEDEAVVVEEQTIAAAPTSAAAEEAPHDEEPSAE